MICIRVTCDYLWSVRCKCVAVASCYILNGANVAGRHYASVLYKYIVMSAPQSAHWAGDVGHGGTAWLALSRLDSAAKRSVDVSRMKNAAALYIFKDRGPRRSSLMLASFLSTDVANGLNQRWKQSVGSSRINRGSAMPFKRSTLC